MAMKELVKLREEIKKRKPKFVRYLYRRYKKLRRSGYRRPKGRHNKMRLRIFGKPRMVSISYGAPKKARGLHPSGYAEVLIHNAEELENVDPATQAVRIASSVGTKKKLEILKKAEKLGIKVLNPRIKRRSWKKLKAREEKKKEKEKEEEKKEMTEEKTEQKEEKKKPSGVKKAKQTKKEAEEERTDEKKPSKKGKAVSAKSGKIKAGKKTQSK